MQCSHTGKNILIYMASSITSFYLPSAYFFKATGATVHDILHKKVLWLETHTFTTACPQQVSSSLDKEVILSKLGCHLISYPK